jgi:HSP20 family molecular chaperone IbpA
MTYKGIEEVKMSKYSNQVYLNQMFDNVTKFIGDVITTGDNTTYTITTAGDYYYTPYKVWDYKDTFWIDLWNHDFTIPSVPSYPVSNYSILKDGSSLIEIAVSGFDEDEILIEKVESKIIVKGKKEKKEEKVKKYLYKNIASRDFELEFQGSDSWDYSKIEAEIDKGILSIRIPLKEDFKPLEIPIKKKK